MLPLRWIVRGRRVSVNAPEEAREKGITESEYSAGIGRRSLREEPDYWINRRDLPPYEGAKGEIWVDISRLIGWARSTLPSGREPVVRLVFSSGSEARGQWSSSGQSGPSQSATGQHQPTHAARQPTWKAEVPTGRDRLYISGIYRRCGIRGAKGRDIPGVRVSI